MLPPPTWLTTLAILALAVAVLSAAYILWDIVRHRRQIMPVMKWVWPITALYLGPLAIWAYRTMALAREHRPGNRKPEEPFWHAVFKGVTHCGGGCTLGDIVGEWAVFVLGWTIAGLALWPAYFVDFALAFTLGIVFQYFAIAPMRHLGPKDGVVAALKADTLSLTAFEVGLFGWMALASFGFFHHALRPDDPVYWFMMQVGMAVGFATAYPMNWWLIRRGLKERM
ncbi:MAG TPA: DUF4396 domain-containing protein [Thermomicrobiales bacterium]|nr:DUF4396 domain-containing protein [Thermomicrobiales bacterium]